MKTKTKRIIFDITIFAFLSLILICADLRRDNSLKQKFLDQVVLAQENRTVFDVNTVTDFDWDRMYFIDSDSGFDRKEAKKRFCGEGIAFGDHTFAVIFYKGPSIVSYFEISYSEKTRLYISDCAREVFNGCESFTNTPSSAMFLIKKPERKESSSISYFLKCYRKES